MTDDFEDYSKPLDNPAHELFAQKLAEGENQSAAYEMAGYEPDRGHASRLASNGSVQKRVAYLQSVAAERAIVSLEERTRRMLEAEEGARGAVKLDPTVVGYKQLSDMYMSTAKLNGLIVDKTQHTGGQVIKVDPGPLTEEDREFLDGLSKLLQT